LQVVMPREIEGDGHFQLTETTSPKQIGVFVAGENKGMRGIYKLEGDRLTLCMNLDPAGAFPATFAAPEGTEFDLIVMRQPALPKSDLPRQIAGHEANVRSLAFSPDGTRLLSSSDNGMLLMHDVATGRQLREFSGHNRSIRSVSFSADGTRVLSSGWDNTIRLWDVATGETIRVIEDGNGLLHSSRLNAAGNRIISCSHVGQSEGAIRVWDVETGKLLKEFEKVTFQPFEVVLSPEGDRALSGGHDAVMRLWDIETGKVIREYRGHSDWVRTVAFSKDGQRAVSGSKDNSIRVWDVETGELLRTLTGHTNLVESAVFTPDGRRVLSGSMDGSIRLWDVSTGEELAGFGSPAVVNVVAISPDGLTAASGGDDKLIRVWKMSELHPIGDSLDTNDTNIRPDEEDGEQIKHAAIQSAQKWLELLDAGEYGKCWDEMAPEAKESVTREGLIDFYEPFGKPRGKAVTRTLLRIQPDRRNPKRLIELTYKTKFESGGVLYEQLLMHIDSHGQWRVGALIKGDKP
ncbi:MAG TPA: DUF4019 domain-containing protein, partial [Planctomycetaceae bacterium]|nr:DUF4019 domain-containing protein [Planctomycetaceae bacterium]